MRIKKNKNGLTVVMYHHIVVRKKYFNGISFAKFKKQITYFKKNYNILSPKEFYEKLKKKTFNNDDCLITFDDGYQSQYHYAFNFLNSYNLKAFFFPMVLGCNSNKIHQVNKIHLLLKLSKNKQKLFEEIKFLIKNNNIKIFKNLKKIINNIKTKKFYDDSIDIIIKRLLQRDLPLKLREKICNKLFNELNIKKNAIKNMYMNDMQLKKLKENGHEIGVHTLNHFWLSNLKKTEQSREIKKCLETLRKKKLINKAWSFCYPFGDYNHLSIQILKKLNCTAAFSLKNKIQDIKKIKKFEICRIDCNEFL